MMGEVTSKTNLPVDLPEFARIEAQLVPPDLVNVKFPLESDNPSMLSSGFSEA